jgi:hypothetical protein
MAYPMTLEHTLAIAAPAEDLFDLTQDYDRRRLWDRFLLLAVPINRPWGEPFRPAVGAQVRCYAWLGPHMDVEYVSCACPRVAAVKMIHGPKIVRRFAGSWLFRPSCPQSPGKTLVTFRYHFIARPRCLTRMLGWWFAWETKRRLLALKRFAESQRYLRSPLELQLAPE